MEVRVLVNQVRLSEKYKRECHRGSDYCQKVTTSGPQNANRELLVDTGDL